VLKLAETGDHAVYKYRAPTLLGDIKQRRGDLGGALKSYSDGLAIIEPLAKSDPGNTLWKYDLGVINARIGDIQMAQGISALR
jgi:hypothetical protein